MHHQYSCGLIVLLKEQEIMSASYSPFEEKLNIITHAIGIVIAVASLVVLVVRSAMFGTGWHLAGSIVFGISMIVLYSASTAYHSVRSPQLRQRLRVFDHTAIYVLIAGTYTPFALVTLNGTTGWIIFGLAWGLALTGTILKLFFTGRFNHASTILYVSMGWMAIFVIRSLFANLSIEAFFWLIGGGVAYTVGAVLYSIDRIPLNHAIFHVFVLLGTICHVITVGVYLI